MQRSAADFEYVDAYSGTGVPAGFDVGHQHIAHGVYNSRFSEFVFYPGGCRDTIANDRSKLWSVAQSLTFTYSDTYSSTNPDTYPNAHTYPDSDTCHSSKPAGHPRANFASGRGDVLPLPANHDVHMGPRYGRDRLQRGDPISAGERVE